MFLWWVYLDTVEWGVYITAPSRGRAKSIFWHCSTDACEYTDIKVRKLKSADGFGERFMDMDCPELEALGVRYMTEEEYDEYMAQFNI